MSESKNGLTGELSQTLESSEFGHFINENKKSVIIAGIVTLVLIIAYSFYGHFKSTSVAEKLNEAYEFNTSAVSSYLEGKTSSDELLASFHKLSSSALTSESLLPTLLEVSSKLALSNETDKAVDLLSTYYKSLSTSTLAHYLLSVNYAAYLEDNKNFDDAVSVLNQAMATKFEVLKDKVYFDLGRIYLLQANTEKSKEMFNYLIKTYPESTFIKLANLYLNDL